MPDTAEPKAAVQQTAPITIDIVSDTVCPWCFVGKRRLERALAQLGPDVDVRIGWRPFQLNPEMPKDGMARAEYLAAKFGGNERAGQIYQAVRQAGAGEGIDFAFDKMARQPNTINSHRLIDRAGREGKQDQVVEILFRTYFIEARDIGNIDTLVEAAAEAGMNADAVRAYLTGDEDVERIQAEDQMARRMGVQGVPCFILNRKYAVSGAQDPEVLLQAIAQVQHDQQHGTAHEHEHGDSCGHDGCGH